MAEHHGCCGHCTAIRIGLYCAGFASHEGVRLSVHAEAAKLVDSITSERKGLFCMKKSSRLQPVVKVAESREQQAAQALGMAQTQLTQAEQRLAELKVYREDYIARFHSAGAAGMGALQMEDYRQFLHKLSLAIDQQGQVIAQAASEVEVKRQGWHQNRSKTQMLDTVVSRYQAEEQRVAERKEQGEQDERAQRPSVDKA